jgi:outer membrane murein-binding lipoprotein Lpp
MNINPLKVIAVAAVIVVGSGCASNGRVDELQALNVSAEQSINEANEAAAAAQAASDRAQATADQALATSNAANMTAEEANEKIDRAFKSSMEK